MSLQINVRLQHPFSMLVAGETGAGKTTFTKHLLNPLVPGVHQKVTHI